MVYPSFFLKELQLSCKADYCVSSNKHYIFKKKITITRDLIYVRLLCLFWYLGCFLLEINNFDEDIYLWYSVDEVWNGENGMVGISWFIYELQIVGFFSPFIEDVLDDTELESKLDEVGDKQKHQLKHRELFLSRQVETLPATHIRGKCTVTLLNETESLLSYLNKEVSLDFEFFLIQCVRKLVKPTYTRLNEWLWPIMFVS